LAGASFGRAAVAEPARRDDDGARGDNGRTSVASAVPQMDVGGDRDDLQPGDRLVLIVEHDPKFAAILLEMAHQMGFKGLITSRGEMALELAQSTNPDAITLDLRLPDMAGWVVLDRLKHHPGTSHIPVHVISGDESWRRGVKRGAFAALQKPVDPRSLRDAFANLRSFLERRIRTLLVVEDNEIERRNIIDSVGDEDVRVTAASNGAEALAALKGHPFDCVVVDLGLPDMSGIHLIESIRKDPATATVPVIVYTGRDVTPGERAHLEAMVESVITKDARSMERLLGETTIFLHRLEKDLVPAVKEAVAQARQAGEGIAHKKVLIVDDDVRNIYALTSMLEHWDMDVLSAEHGREALEILARTPGIDAVLMDIMMPEMDGYQTTRAIREQPQFHDLPIIALTAKAMKDDRRKCLDAGASDYIAKPVHGEQLRSLLRVWLDRPQ
jgi:CheY-like chemotaxis protein